VKIELAIGIAGVQQRREDHAARRDPEQHERVDVSRMENDLHLVYLAAR
jgi:hypothetical protein